MNASRTQIVLGGLLLLQLALILLFRAPWAEASRPGEPELLFPQLADAEALRIVLSEPADEEAGDPARELALVREGEGWLVEEAGGFPAAESEIVELLETLEGLRVRRPVVTSARYHEAFGVEDDAHEARVRIYGAADASSEPLADLLLGSSSNYRAVHARRAGEDEVWEVTGLAVWDVRPEPGSWIDKTLAEVPPERVTRITVENPAGRFELVRQEGAWRVAEPAERAGMALDADEVESLVRTAATLRLSGAAGRVEPAAQGFDPPAARVVLEWTAAAPDPAEPPTDGTAAPPASAATERVEILIGAEAPEESERYVTREGHGFAGKVWSATLTALVEADLAKLEAGEDDAAAGAG